MPPFWCSADPMRNTSRVSALVAQRLLVLTAVALLCGLAALAAVERRSQEDGVGAIANVAASAGWYTAFAGSRGATGDAQRTSCGHVLSAGSLGVTHPVLPCDAKMVLRYGDRLVLSEVIDNALVEPGRQLEVTEALARLLELEDTAEIEWRFATETVG
jgi:hypothetical protein